VHKPRRRGSPTRIRCGLAFAVSDELFRPNATRAAALLRVGRSGVLREIGDAEQWSITHNITAKEANTTHRDSYPYNEMVRYATKVLALQLMGQATTNGSCRERGAGPEGQKWASARN
jgi:hypothetical protein